MKLEKIFIVTDHETLNLLYEAYDDEMSRTQIYELHKRFEKGRIYINE